MGGRLGVHRQMRVVELFGLLLSLVCWCDLARLCGVDLTTVTRWVAGTVGVPHAVIRLLELMRDIRLSLLKSPTGHGIGLPTKRVADAS